LAVDSLYRFVLPSDFEVERVNLRLEESLIAGQERGGIFIGVLDEGFEAFTSNESFNHITRYHERHDVDKVR
jgi:hypothetical protein